jgi:hypothetical protein
MLHYPLGVITPRFRAIVLKQTLKATSTSSVQFNLEYRIFRFFCVTVFSSGASSYAMVRIALNVATRQTTRVARDLIRPKTRHSRIAAGLTDCCLAGSTELHTRSFPSHTSAEERKVFGYRTAY